YITWPVGEKPYHPTLTRALNCVRRVVDLSALLRRRLRRRQRARRRRPGPAFSQRRLSAARGLLLSAIAGPSAGHRLQRMAFNQRSRRCDLPRPLLSGFEERYYEGVSAF